MNSPPHEMDSPTSSSGANSPSEDPVALPPVTSTSHSFHSKVGSSPTQSKRRLPVGGGNSAREPKTRRKDEGRGSGYSIGMAGPMGGAVGDARARGKEELIDTKFMDSLRTQYGDPFDERDLTHR